MWYKKASTTVLAAAIGIYLVNSAFAVVQEITGLFAVFSRHFLTTLLSASKLLEHCTPHVQKPPTFNAASAPLLGQQQQLLRGVHFLDVTSKNL
ncbi:unnamed protein product [Larinioides sclopetarius]|uniref:Secreted protein n=1 Tax=Larinioides sclopetarius TaxID=280406 RepID=A0AAV2A798_9ARAC